MNLYIKLAWRNIWRNKRRTLITGASVLFGVVLSTYITSMQEGSYSQMIDAIVGSYSGHLQVMQKGYWDDRSINKTFEYSPDLKKAFEKIEFIQTQTPRLESFALASGGELTKGTMVMGIAPEQEDSVTHLSEKLISGRFLKAHDEGVVIGSGLARYMHIDVNDTIVLLSQGYHGVSAAGKFPVIGIIKHPSPDFDRAVVYMDINLCQDFYLAQNRVTTVVFMVDDPDFVEDVTNKLLSIPHDNLEIKNWKEINSLLLKQIESDRISGLFIKGILYLIISFGIFSTMMMMAHERQKEFAVLIAVGMQKFRLERILLIESVFIGLIGSLAGLLISLPIVWYYFFHPIEFSGQAAESMLQMGFEPVMWFSMDPMVFLQQAIIVMLITLIIGLYPVWFTQSLKLIKALRS